MNLFFQGFEKQAAESSFAKAAFSLFGSGTGPSTPPPTPPSPPTSTGPRMNPAGVKSLKNAFGG